MEIFFTEYRCASCGCGVENIRSVHLDVPFKLDVECPECKGTLELFSVNRMVRQSPVDDYSLECEDDA